MNLIRMALEVWPVPIDPRFKMVYTCDMCKSLSPSFKLHVSHIKLVHSKSPDFLTVYPLSYCGVSFTTFPSYNSHIYRHHWTVFGRSSQQPPEDLIQNSAEISPESPQLQMASMIDSAQFRASQCAATCRQVCYNDRFIPY